MKNFIQKSDFNYENYSMGYHKLFLLIINILDQEQKILIKEINEI